MTGPRPLRWPEPRWWDLGVGGVVVVTLAAVWLSGAGGERTAAAALALGLFIAAYAAWGRRAIERGPGRLAFGLTVVAVCFAGALAHPSFAVFQGIAFPLAWTVAERTRLAVALNVAIAAAIGAGYALSTGAPAEAAAVEALSLAMSLALGFWISQIEHLSAQRRELIVELTATQEQNAALGRDAGAALERERIARDMHDTVAQSLTGIVMLAERAKARHPADELLGVLEGAAREALGETRALVAATAGVPLTGGLRAAIDDLAARFRRETGMRVDTAVSAAVPRPLEVVLLRCAQEALANVRKHARADSAIVTIEPVGNRVRLTVRDDGVGIRADGDGAGFGLAGMRERLALVGGALAVRATEPHGTELVVEVPA